MTISPSPDPSRVTTLIEDVAKAEIMPRFNRLAAHDISEKAPGDLVTIADTEAEKALSQGLTSLLGGSVAIGEEGVAADPDRLALVSGDQPVWIIDPVDGTHNFAHGTPCFAVIVSLVHAGCIIAGWIHDPVTGATIHATQGDGAWEGGARLEIPPAVPLTQMTGSLKRSHRHRVRDREQQGEAGFPSIIKRYRCVGREYMDLARGKLDFVAYSGQLKPWDHAAGVLIYREAGGFDAMIDSKSAYEVRPTPVRAEVLLAPGKPAWDRLSQLIEGL